MNALQGFAVINDTIGKKIAFTYTEINKDGDIIKSNIKSSFVAIDPDLLESIKKIEDIINAKINNA